MKPLTQDDHLKWRQFLASPAGEKGIAYLEARKPAIYKDDHSHNIILAAGEQNGHAIALSQLRALPDFDESPQSDDTPANLESTRTR